SNLGAPTKNSPIIQITWPVPRISRQEEMRGKDTVYRARRRRKPVQKPVRFWRSGNRGGNGNGYPRIARSSHLAGLSAGRPSARRTARGPADGPPCRSPLVPDPTSVGHHRVRRQIESPATSAATAPRPQAFLETGQGRWRVVGIHIRRRGR